jgi:hypothetical protein
MPQPMMPQPVMPQMNGGQTVGGTQSSTPGRSMQYFIDMGEAEKHIKHCISEIDFNNAKAAIEFIN